MPDAAPLRLALAVARYFEFGGMPRAFRRLAGELVARGHEVHAYAREFAGPLPEDVVVHELPVRALTNHGRNAAFARHLATAVARPGGYDLVVGFTKIPGLDLYYAGDTCYRQRAAELPLAALRRLTPRYRALAAQEEAVFGRGRGVHAMLVAAREKAVFQRWYGTEDERFHVLPPGLDRDRLEAGLREADARPFDAPRGLEPGRPFLLMVGSGFRTKGVDRAIEAFAGLDASVRGDLALVIVGEGKAAPLERLARRLGRGDDVIFAGPRRDVASFYRHAVDLVHPARLENTGNVLLEALFCGLPVLDERGLRICADHWRQPGRRRRRPARSLDPEAFRRWGLRAQPRTPDLARGRSALLPRDRSLRAGRGRRGSRRRSRAGAPRAVTGPGGVSPRGRSSGDPSRGRGPDRRSRRAEPPSSSRRGRRAAPRAPRPRGGRRSSPRPRPERGRRRRRRPSPRPPR
ncbi:MAG: glycosyltransferase family 4 protein [Planctomycetota bacterium]